MHILPQLTEAQRLYLDLLKKCLTRFVFEKESYRVVRPRATVSRLLFWAVRRTLGRRGLTLVRTFDAVKRESGLDWPLEAETMIGLRRLENLEMLVRDIVGEDIAGDIVETGSGGVVPASS